MNPNSILKTLQEIDKFLIDLRYILTSDNYELDILPRKKDEDPLDPFTTENTLIDLDYNSEDVKNELLSLTSKDYVETIIDDKDPNRPPFWVFGKDLKSREVYIKVKIRNKLTNNVFCVSFHYARFSIRNKPYA